MGHTPSPVCDWPVTKSYHRPAHRRVHELGPQATAQASARARGDFLKIGYSAPFSECLHIKGRNFSDVFYPFRSRLPMTPTNHKKFHGNRSSRFSKIRKTDTQTDRCGNFIYIEVYDQCKPHKTVTPWRCCKCC